LERGHPCPLNAKREQADEWIGGQVSGLPILADKDVSGSVGRNQPSLTVGLLTLTPLAI